MDLRNGTPSVWAAAVITIRTLWIDQPGHIHKVSYLLACVKQITFEDGTVWNNPEYENWYTTYQGVPVDLDVAKSYYD